MTQIMNKWKTTKLPLYYFEQIENYLNSSTKYISVSDFIRDAIENKLNSERTTINFLIYKDVVFNETKLTEIHELILKKHYVESNRLLNKSFNKIIEMSLDTDMFIFLAKFLKNFAKYHPFEDGNKRTALIAVDLFLRTNSLKFKLKFSEKGETSDEQFFWQNSTQQKKIEDIVRFLKSHVIAYSSKSLDDDLEMSIKENKLILEKLSK